MEFILGPPSLVRRCVLAKQAADLQTNTLGQHLLAELVSQAGFEAHVERLRREYRARRDALEHALAEGLAFVPGGEFHRDGEGKDTLRLNFTHSSPARIAEGAARLARALDRYGRGRG